MTNFAQAQALTCARQYAGRWMIENFHKVLKTGLGAEKLQLQMAARLFAAVVLLSVVALALVDLREKSRLEPDAQTESAGLTVNVARISPPKPPSLDSVRAVNLAVAVLGGHLGRIGERPTRLANSLARSPKPTPACGGRKHGGATA